MKVQIHAQITIQANDDLLGTDQLATVVNHNMLVDLDQLNSCLHFDNCAFGCGTDQVAQQWALVEAQSDRLDSVALSAFGRLLHTTQDFYAHSNWVEIHVGQDPIPTWDQQVASLPAGIVSGTFFLDTPKECSPGGPSHADLNKDDAASTEGSNVVASGPNKGKTMFQLAFAAAVAASKLQFQRLGKGVPAEDVQRTRPGLVSGNQADIAQLVGSISDRAQLERDNL